MSSRPDPVAMHAGPKAEEGARPTSRPLHGAETAAPPRELRILLLEDSVPHAELVEHFLRGSGLKINLTRVETRDAFVDQIEHHTPDMILSDYALPSFDGYAALAIAK